MVQVAILDDYTNAALTSTDWDILPDGYRLRSLMITLLKQVRWLND